MHRLRQLLVVVLLAVVALEAQAYIGPGLGAGAIGVVLGVIASIFVAIFAIIWYPIRRALRKNRKKTDESKPGQRKPDAPQNE